jgi:hypothetical protein
MRRRSANDACGDATPSNKPLEWTGHHKLTSGTRYSLPATQGQRSKDREEKAESPGGKRGLEGVGRSC